MTIVSPSKKPSRQEAKARSTESEAAISEDTAPYSTIKTKHDSLPSKEGIVAISLINFSSCALHFQDYLTSPRSIEACKRIGIEQVSLLEKQLSDFAEVGLHATFQKKRHEHYERRRQSRLKDAIDERSKIIAEGIMEKRKTEQVKDVLKCHAVLDSETKTKNDALGFVQKEQKRLEIMRERQKAEMEQVLIYELRIQELQRQNQLKIEAEEEADHRRKLEHMERMKEWEHQRKLKEDKKRLREAEERRRQEDVTAQEFQAQLLRIEQERKEDRRRRKELQERELERRKRQEDRAKQVEELHQEHCRKAREREEELHIREKERLDLLSKQKAEAQRLLRKKAEVQARRIHEALKRDQEALNAKKTVFEEREIEAEARRKEFREQHQIQLEHKQRKAKKRQLKIKDAVQRIRTMHEKRKDAYFAEEEKMIERQREMEIELQREELAKKDALEKSNAQRLAKLHEQRQREAEMRQSLLKHLEAQDERLEKIRQQREFEQQQRKEMDRLTRLDRQEAIERDRRAENYRRLRILAKIEEENQHLKHAQRQKQSIVNQRQQIAREARQQKELITMKLAQRKVTGKFNQQTLKKEFGMEIDLEKIRNSVKRRKQSAAYKRRSRSVERKNSKFTKQQGRAKTSSPPQNSIKSSNDSIIVEDVIVQSTTLDLGQLTNDHDHDEMSATLKSTNDLTNDRQRIISKSIHKTTLSRVLSQHRNIKVNRPKRKVLKSMSTTLLENIGVCGDTYSVSLAWLKPVLKQRRNRKKKFESKGDEFEFLHEQYKKKMIELLQEEVKEEERQQSVK